MLKAAIEKILSLDEPHIKSIEGRTYVDKNMRSARNSERMELP